MSSNVKILQPTGILDQNNSVSLRQQVEDLIKKGDKIILIDFKNVTFMDSFGLGTLILIRRIITEKDGRLFLMSLNEQLRMLLFELTNTGKYFEVVADEAELETKLSS